MFDTPIKPVFDLLGHLLKWTFIRDGAAHFTAVRTEKVRIELTHIIVALLVANARFTYTHLRSVIHRAGHIGGFRFRVRSLGLRFLIMLGG